MASKSTTREYPPTEWVRAKELYLTTHKSIKEIAEITEIPEGRIRRRIKDDGWAETRDHLEAELTRELEMKTRRFAKEHQLEVAKRHYEVAKEFESFLGDVVRKLRNMSKRIKEDDKIFPSDLRQLEHLARAFKSVADISDRATGMGHTVKGGHDGGQLLPQGGILLVGFQPHQVAQPGPRRVEAEVSDSPF